MAGRYDEQVRKTFAYTKHRHNLHSNASQPEAEDESTGHRWSVICSEASAGTSYPIPYARRLRLVSPEEQGKTKTKKSERRDPHRLSQDESFRRALRHHAVFAVTTYNVLYFIEDAASAIARIHGLLEPGGLFLSATDCLGERPSLTDRLKDGMSLLEILPFLRMFTAKELGRP